MVSIIRQSINLPDQCILPHELIKPILDKVNNKIVKLSSNGLSVFDFNTRQLIRTIESCCYFKLSVSRCGNFAVCSNENLPIHIWNINTGLKVQINKVFANKSRIQLHTFTLNNELLLPYKNCIYSFEYSEEQESWILNHVYEITENVDFVSIQHNQLEHTFACATTSGNIYIFNSLYKTQSNMLVNTNIILSIQFNNNILVVIGMNGNYVLDISTNTRTDLQKPDELSNYQYSHIGNFFLLPCLTKLIGTSRVTSFILDTQIAFIWDIQTGQFIKRLNNVIDIFNTLSPEGTQIVTCNRSDSSIILHNIQDLL
jgi:WD40 repeat protein